MEDSARPEAIQMVDRSSLLQESASKMTTIRAIVHDLIPITHWLPNYSIRRCLLSDVVGGLTVGIMHVPQGIAYASLAGVRPVIGLYTSLIPPLLYMLFGTSRHISIGVFAVVSLMSGACNVRITEEMITTASTNLTGEALADAKLDYAINVLGALGLLVGLIQIAMGLLKLDFLLSFLSEQVVSGFMVGASIHVFVAQLDKLLGLTLPRRTGIGKLFKTLHDVVQSISKNNINLYSTCISIVAIASLCSVKFLIDPRVKKLTQLPVPYDLILLVLGALLSAVFDFSGALQMQTIGKIPTGLPAVALPDLSIVPRLWLDAVAVSVVVVVVSVSMAKLFAEKHAYDIRVRQELFALGMTQAASSFFPTWPSSTALARTLVYEAAGTKTQLATLFSSMLLLAVLFIVGPYMEVLPVCLLSCVIVVALKGMFLKLGDVLQLWRVSRLDAMLFVVTFTSTAALNIIEGLVLGAGLSLVHLLLQARRGGRLETADDNDEGVHARCHAEETGACVQTHFRRSARARWCRYDGSLCFLNADVVVARVRKMASTMRHESLHSAKPEEDSRRATQPTLRLWMDLSGLQYVDYSGCTSLFTLISTLKMEYGIRLIYLATSDSVLKMVEAHKLFKLHRTAFHDDDFDGEESC